MKHKSGIKTSLQSGFTLVELAIVMTVIGLLIGGVLKGQELIENAKMKATITQIHEMSTAVTAFQDIYGSLPGDLASADRSVPGCVFPCGAGDGNGMVGRANQESIGGIIQATNSQAGTDATPEVETTWFWQHLMLTGLIHGVEVADPNTPAWGVTHPASELPGGLHVGYVATGEPFSTDIPSGHYIAFRAEMRGLPGNVTTIAEVGNFKNGTLAASPHLAENIDRKMDDGKPLDGMIMAPSLVGLGCNNGPNSEYDGTSKHKNCLLSALIVG